MRINFLPIRILAILCLLTSGSTAVACCVPELDPGSMVGGLTLLAGSLALVMSQRKKP
jgi:hypothetical protein